MKKPAEIIQMMMAKDAFSNWLGLEVLTIEKGSCAITCSIKGLMLNGFSIAHGGIAYSIADTTLAFAANSYGYQSFSIETSISHTKKVTSGDKLTATSKQINKSSKTELYYITIINQNNQEVAHFKGTIFRTEKEWFPKS